MPPLAVTRAAYFQIFADILDEIGDPVGTWMDASRLPESLREDPNLFVPNAQALGFLRAANNRSDITEFAFRCSQRVKFSFFAPKTRRAVLGAPTLYRALCAFINEIPAEDTALKFWIRGGGSESIRIVCAPKTGRVQNFSSWMQIAGVVELVRAFAGADWAPEEIAFMGDFPPGTAASADFPNTRFRTSQKTSWVSVPMRLLHLKPRLHDAKSEPTGALNPVDPTMGIPASLRGVLRSHIEDGTPHIQTMAELNCTSVRTLQRGLSAAGTTFSELVHDVRCEMARELLADPKNRIIDVSMAVGYSDPSHFSRFFREVYGKSPTEHRASA